MATDLLPQGLEQENDHPASARAEVRGDLRQKSILRTIVEALASLKLTVALFGLATVLVFAGTMAQTRYDVWWVVHNYFRCGLAWIELKMFFPPAWFAGYPSLVNMPGSFPFPGGMAIGGLMAVNLLAAHGLRFTIQAKGARLWSGLAVIAAGVGVTLMVILSGPGADGVQAAMPIDWKLLWRVFLIGLGLGCVAIAVSLFTLGEDKRPHRIVLGISGTALLAAWAYLLFKIDVDSIDPDPMVSAMRVLWQLIKAETAALILLGGCILVFRKRAGIVLLHAGIGLIMANELVVHFMHQETLMRLEEGETTNFTQDVRSYELAVIDPSYSQTENDVVVVPQALLEQSLASGKAISDENLPFDVRMTKFFPNSAIATAKGDEAMKVDAPGGALAVAPLPPAVGTEAESTNFPAAYVEFTEKQSGKLLGTLLLNTAFPFMDASERPVQQLTAGGKQYDVSLQFERQYRPFSVHLYNVTREDYPGTTIPRSYASEIQLYDPTRGVDLLRTVRMNEPTRYGGATIYQSGNPMPGTTIFQVIDNFGWMIPYVGCMIVGTGLLAHFSLVLVRFLRRREEGRIAVGDALWGSGSATASASAVLDQRDAPSSRRKQRKARQAAAGKFGLVRAIRLGLPLAAGLAAAGLMFKFGTVPNVQPSKEMNLYEFGKLPIEAGGRILPIDALSRNYLRLVSLRETYLEASGLQWKLDKGTLLVTDVLPGSPAQAAGIVAGDRIESIDGRSPAGMKEKEIVELLEGVDGTELSLSVTSGDQPAREVPLQRAYQPAIKWMLDWAAVPELAAMHRVFRIENPQVLSQLKLDRRKYYRYSWDEINKNREAFDELRDALAKRGAETYTVAEKKAVELDKRIQLQHILALAFRNRPIPAFPTEAEREANPELSERKRQAIAQWFQDFPAMQRQLSQVHPPHAVPVWPESDESRGETSAEPWSTYSAAWAVNYLRGIPGIGLSRDPSQARERKAVAAWESMFDAYAAQDPASFNRAVADYQAMLAHDPPQRLEGTDAGFEAWFNHWHPFFTCQWIYFAAFCFAALAWLGWKKPLNRTAFVLIAVAFATHTAALCFRMYISGRPPVTNLYSSAIFIGWAAVAAGLVLEGVYRSGFGNVLASIAGYSTLLIADKLALSVDSSRGDTVGVMQAVLDTQFWLATHVTTITLGYTATFVAGLLGLIYVVLGVFTKGLGEVEGKNLARMIYGTVCFGIFFSFVGTVLGGLWADDSWGRFWGWDPKENGALLIVLWNAIILHARWDGMIKDRGLAVLAIGGNIVTAWSWFGVNQLGVGLHSYGFTEGVVLALGVFVLSQLAMIAAGLIPTRLWMSQRTESAVH